MTNPIRTCVTAALVAAATVPATALAGPGHHHGGGFGGDASKRTELRVQRVEASLEKAVDAIDDGDDATATTKLASVDRNLGRALKAANRQIDGDKGPGSLGLVAEAADEVALTTADSMDGASQGLTDALEGSLDNALNTRDAIVGSIAALDDGSDYEDVASDISGSSEDEADSFTEGAEDDDLVASGETALTDAAAQATATATAADALAGDGEDADESDDDEDSEEDGDCPPHGGPQGPSGGPTGPNGSSQGSPRVRP